MTHEKMKSGEISKPRFEFRSFDSDFAQAASRMAELSTSVPEHVKVRHSDEVYIMSRTNDENNTRQAVFSGLAR